MPIQVAAHGFPLTDAIRDSCVTETREKLQPLALHNFSARWVLSLEAGEHVTHVNWTDGSFHGDVTVKTSDMYQSIHHAGKKAVEQLKKAHSKRYDHNHASGMPVANGFSNKDETEDSED
jgi:ribosome-associated translation inhibitor RaiA